jgi:hypothetical protein
MEIDSIMDIIAHHSNNSPDIYCKRHARVLRLSIPKENQHIWSPVMHLSFDREENHTIIRGLIGPSESIWQTIMVFYLSVSILGFLGSMYALVEWQLRDNWLWLSIIPITVLALSSIFAISASGKKQAHAQMLHLLLFLRRSVDQTSCMRIET